MLDNRQLYENWQVTGYFGTLRKCACAFDSARRGKARHRSAILAHDRARLFEGPAPTRKRAVRKHIDRRERGHVTHLAHAHERAQKVTCRSEPVQEKGVELLALEQARGAGVLIAVLIERRLARRVERQAARPDLHKNMLRFQRTQNLERGASHIMGAILHSNLRHSSRRDSRGARHKTLGPGHGLQTHRFLNRIGLEDGHQLEVSVDVDALARKRSGNRGGNDEHIFVEAKGNVGHGASFLVFPIIAYARRRASLEGPVPHISHSARTGKMKLSRKQARGNGDPEKARRDRTRAIPHSV